jgi:hypothetical protein
MSLGSAPPTPPHITKFKDSVSPGSELVRTLDIFLQIGGGGGKDRMLSQQREEKTKGGKDSTREEKTTAKNNRCRHTTK